jgi:hypothetical protein
MKSYDHQQELLLKNKPQRYHHQQTVVNSASFTVWSWLMPHIPLKSQFLLRKSHAKIWLTMLNPNVVITPP